jgi:hypothetical protein
VTLAAPPRSTGANPAASRIGDDETDDRDHSSKLPGQADSATMARSFPFEFFAAADL